ncbi:NAD(P)/FAD-dependent oxidoreductase [Streptomyces melanosporofaciens]|uniref:Dehydrogenase (Flavoprotein) n=1 Tax=Streptomyces melanosporofaciens TaxID=67327 RepID=A0A1H4KR11_STRMJ|nr:FAD-dependent oxidoreductase [Streptomyces melanosporofaciens]SEB60538.1 Dehydrogenase (flavoprotein) [Streptomyces melanosporofaciens]
MDGDTSLMRTPAHAVVLGGGLAGTLAAAALSSHMGKVTIVERYHLPDGPGTRRGVPQARHAHLMWSGGARAIESLLPGTIRRWTAAGAREIGVPSGLVSLTAQGWLRRGPRMQFIIICSRDLLDWVVRKEVLANNRITMAPPGQAIALLGNPARVTGVRVRDEASGRETELQADFVVDATGRTSQASSWLANLGLTAPAEETVDSGLTYATRIFQAPKGTPPDFPLINVQADHLAARPGQSATLIPIENRRWLVTLSGTRGGEPPTDASRFVDFARGVRHPIVGDLIARARPDSPVYSSHSTANRRRYFERLPHWPDGFIVLGDAVATYNPIYGHGMSVAARSAAALHHGLAQHSMRPGAARRIQRTIAGTTEGAWTTATSQDVLYPQAIGAPPTMAARLLQRYVDRLVRTASDRPAAAAAFYGAFALSKPMSQLLSPKAALATLLGPTRPALSTPPLSDELLFFASPCSAR